ncbi:glycoside hydrolase family 2 protein [Parapedobacter sp. 10938]|uniref:glycoside hydrolase family 2 protein n=1 Tax=Parapedobacter flavus TaxID=3110225 RepID=UPI002DBF2B39|nr:sugar-binding domain-containing protein [Parapedobacter sp. 10938]MEC3878145.1 sugar-binding domain-containing protein [Parapedobacter sp. 10938]
MKTIYSTFFFLSCFLLGQLNAQESSAWQPAGDKIKSAWVQDIDVSSLLPEYPRPQLVREQWQNLNGLWDYAIVPGKLGSAPGNFDGQILVPFAVESALSGVGKTVGKDSSLWYRRTVTLDKKIRKQQVLLHFGAVDWKCDVYVNGQKAGTHEGGYDPFSIDITPYLAKGAKQEIVVGVWDPTDEGPQPNGKQVVRPHGIWYTPVTGIWQTVWIEGVPETHIAATKQTPDIDRGTLSVHTTVAGARQGDQVRVSAWKDGAKVTEETVSAGAEASLTIENAQLWSPTSPTLYDLKVAVLRKGKVVDEVTSYFAMRKISMAKDANGIQRMLLNNEFVFQYGPLDQGWWPDGLYTAPTDEALRFDVEKTKEMGFNMIRKHIKVEPARWYYHCDQLGLLVWQDMPSGDLGGNKWDMRPGITSGLQHDKDRSAESEAIYRKEWKSIMDALHNFPSIVVWVPFNEAWGQFKTEEITEWTVTYDPSRLVNSASGGNFYETGHIMDIHNYPDAVMPRPEIYGDTRILVLGEFGGLGLPVEGHTWQNKDNWGYQSFKNVDELKRRYSGLVKDLARLIPLGLSAAVYTQTTDVEIETNGLMTYDRAVVKMPAAELHQWHQQLYKIKVD